MLPMEIIMIQAPVSEAFKAYQKSCGKEYDVKIISPKAGISFGYLIPN